MGGILSSTGFKVTGSDAEQFLDDDGQGNVLRRFFLVSGVKTYANNTQGTIDYDTGQVTLNSLNIEQYLILEVQAQRLLKSRSTHSNDVVR